MCILVNECCGITFSTGMGWTLRNGGFVRKFDENQADSEPRRMMKTWEVYESKQTGGRGAQGAQGALVKAIWGTVSFRKECVGNETGI